MSKQLETVIIGRTVNEKLINWLNSHNIEFKNVYHSYEPSIARNIAILEFLSTAKNELLMIDADQVPCNDTTILNNTDNPLVYCGYPSRNQKFRGHFGDDDFAAGCFRCSREVLLAMKSYLDQINKEIGTIQIPGAKPVEFGWFHRPVHSYGSEEICCSCWYFKHLADAVGYKPKMVGTIGHILDESTVLFLDKRYTSATGAQYNDISQES